MSIINIDPVYTRWLDRLFAQWRYSPNILKMLEIFSDPQQDTLDVCEYILCNLNLDTDEDIFLDIIGTWLGVERPPCQEDRIFTLCRLGEVQDPWKSFADTSDPDVTVGGYMGSLKGMQCQDDPEKKMSNDDYRKLISQKAISYRKKMTVENFFNYLLEFGYRCRIDDDTKFEAVADPSEYNDLGHWERWYIENKGFKPAGIKVRVEENLRNEDEI
jgi:hypothetical protein